MGIRFEKDTILNWVNEIGKFLGLLVDEYDPFDKPVDPALLEDGYRNFFNQERAWFLGLSQADLTQYVDQDLEAEQIRPLALLFMRDALLLPAGDTQQELLRKAKYLLEYASQKLGSFSFEDYGNLATIDQKLHK